MGLIRGVPPVSTLLESADRNRTTTGLPQPPPPPVPESRNYDEATRDLEQRESELRDELRDSILHLRDRAGRLERRTEAFRTAGRQTGHENSGRPPPPGPLRRLRLSPESVARSHRNFSEPDGPIPTPGAPTRTFLPTPPLDQSDPEAERSFLPEARRSSHPLSNEWTPDSPVDGLGDRNRSPTPADAWEVMRSTIDPDPTLPSADGSFTSAAAAQSFNSQPVTILTVPDEDTMPTSSSDSRRTSEENSDSDSASSVDPDDLVCEEEHDGRGMAYAEVLAEDMYDFEMSTLAGRERVQRQERIRAVSGNRFALPHEPARIDIGFRLIEDALSSDEGRERLLEIDCFDHDGYIQEMIEDRRNPSHRHPQARPRTRSPHTLNDTDTAYGVSELSRRYGPDTMNAVSEATAQVHDYFRRYTADALTRSSNPLSRSRSPPPQYTSEPLTSHPGVEIFISRDAPEPHPVSPPSQRSQNEVTEALLDGGAHEDMGAMRRVVERLARRDDVPESWWMSMGLNLSRTRPQRADGLRGVARAGGDSVSTGRIERRNSRL